MIEVCVSQDVARPPADVFAYVAEPDNLPAWDVAVVQARREFAGPPQLGHRAWTIRRFPTWQAAVVWQITTFDAPTNFELRSVSGPYPMRAHYHYTPTAAGGTHIDLQLDVAVDPWLMGFSQLIGNMMRNELEQSLIRLEHCLRT